MILQGAAGYVSRLVFITKHIDKNGKYDTIIGVKNMGKP